MAHGLEWQKQNREKWNAYRREWAYKKRHGLEGNEKWRALPD